MSGIVHVFGSLNMDLSRRVPQFPGAGETVTGTARPEGPGGKGLNQAVAAARSGARVRMHGALGADAYGPRVRAMLTREGIDASGVRTVDARTATAIVITDHSGENLIVIDRAANEFAVAPPPGTFGVGDLVLLQAEIPWEQNLAAIARAKADGARVILTPAPVADVGDIRDAPVDVLVANQHEAAQLAGAAVEDAATLLAGRIPLVLVTLGAEGVCWAESGIEARRRAAVPAKSVDTTAAGDTFTGALAAQLVGGAALTDAIDWALAAASLTVSRPGSAESVPYASEIRAMVKC